MYPFDPEPVPGATDPHAQPRGAYPPPPVYPTGYPGTNSGAPVSPSEVAALSPIWQSRFDFFRRYGSPQAGTKEGRRALRAMGLWKNYRITNNFLALLFGPIYFAVKGMWRQALTFLLLWAGVATVLTLLGASYSVFKAVGFGFAFLASMTANYAYFRHVNGERSWNPFAGLWKKSRPSNGMPPENPHATPGAVAGNPAVYPPPSAYPGCQGGYPGGYPDVHPVGSWYPTTQPAPSRGKVVAAALVGALVLGGGGFVAYRHFLGADSAPCAVEGAHDVTMNKEVDGEPTVIVPLTGGWEKMASEAFQKAESAGLPPDVRAGFRNDGIRENGFTPDIVVTVKTSTDLSRTADEIHELSIQHIAATATITHQSESTICGNTVYRIDATEPLSSGGHPIHHMYLSVITQQKGTRWGVDLATQTTNPENPEYIAERDAVLKGFRVELPKS